MVKREIQIPVRREGLINDPGYVRADQCFSLVTTSTSSDQNIGTYVVPNNEVYKLQAIVIEVYYTTLSAVAAYLGVVQVRWGNTIITCPLMASNTTSSALFGCIIPIPSPCLEVIGDGVLTLNAICTPTVATSITWKVNLIGYRRLP